MKMSDKIEQSRANARAALDAYRATGNQDPDDVTAIGDLIADLLHLVDDTEGDDLPAWTIAERALNHYGYESDPANRDEEV